MSQILFLDDPALFLDRLAAGMLHFLWQGTAIAAVLSLVLLLLQRSSPRLRYAVCLAGLILMAVCIPLNSLLLPIERSEGSPENVVMTDISVPAVRILPTGTSEASSPTFAATPPSSTAADDRPVIVHDIPEATRTSTAGTSGSADMEGATVTTVVGNHASTGRYSRYIVGAWLIGLVVMLLRMIRGIHRSFRLRLSSRSVTDSLLIRLASEQAVQLGLKITPAIRYCECLAVPIVVGLLNPVILLPPGFRTGLTPAQIRAILCHEMAHIYRLDHWVHLFQHVTESVLFFHPAVWWISRRISVEREICCDDLVLATGCERMEYAGALLRAAELFSQQRARGLVPDTAALRATGTGQTEFGRRIRRLLGEVDSSATGTRPWAIVCVLLIIVFVSFSAFRQPETLAGDEATVTETSADNNGGKVQVPSEAVTVSRNSSPQWGGSSRRNHVADAQLPMYFDVNDGTNIKWTARLGETVYNTPVVAAGKVFIGSSNAGYSEKYPRDSADIGCLLCFEQDSGELLWQYSVPAVPPPNGKFNNQFWPMSGITSAPVVEERRLEWIDGRYQKNRLWLMNNRAEVVCLDVEGFRNGNDGPVQDEADTGPQDADVIWKYDLRENLHVTPAYSPCSSPTLAGDLLLINSSHSPYPLGIVPPDHHAEQVPAFLAFNRNTGKLIWQDHSPGHNILDVAWSSPAFDVINGIPQAIFAGGDGWVYSFDAREIAHGKSKLLWKFDCNPKNSTWQPGGGQGARNSIVATPVIDGTRVYIATGLNPENGEGPGVVLCIDATKRGDVSEELVFSKANPTVPVAARRTHAIDADSGEYAALNPNSALVWKFTGEDLDGDGKIKHGEAMHRSTSCVSVKDGFAVVADTAGYVHCLDAETGKCHWNYDAMALTNGTPMISRNRIYIGDEDGDVAILALAQELSVIAEVPTDTSIHGSLVAGFFNGNRLLVPGKGKLHCVEPITSTTALPDAPRQWQKSARNGSVIAWQSKLKGLHFAIYHEGFMASGFVSSWTDTYWKIEGHVALGTDHRHRVKMAYNCQSPNSVTIEGRRYDLAEGRLFGVDTHGTVVQLRRTRAFRTDNRDEQVTEAGLAVEEARQKAQP